MDKLLLIKLISIINLTFNIEATMISNFNNKVHIKFSNLGVFFEGLLFKIFDFYFILRKQSDGIYLYSSGTNCMAILKDFLKSASYVKNYGSSIQINDKRLRDLISNSIFNVEQNLPTRKSLQFKLLSYGVSINLDFYILPFLNHLGNFVTMNNLLPILTDPLENYEAFIMKKGNGVGVTLDEETKLVQGGRVPLSIHRQQQTRAYTAMLDFFNPSDCGDFIFDNQFIYLSINSYREYSEFLNEMGLHNLINTTHYQPERLGFDDIITSIYYHYLNYKSMGISLTTRPHNGLVQRRYGLKSSYKFLPIDHKEKYLANLHLSNQFARLMMISLNGINENSNDDAKARVSNHLNLLQSQLTSSSQPYWATSEIDNLCQVDMFVVGLYINDKSVIEKILYNSSLNKLTISGMLLKPNAKSQYYREVQTLSKSRIVMSNAVVDYNLDLLFRNRLIHNHVEVIEDWTLIIKFHGAIGDFLLLDLLCLKNDESLTPIIKCTMPQSHVNFTELLTSDEVIYKMPWIDLDLISEFSEVQLKTRQIKLNSRLLSLARCRVMRDATTTFRDLLVYMRSQAFAVTFSKVGYTPTKNISMDAIFDCAIIAFSLEKHVHEDMKPVVKMLNELKETQPELIGIKQHVIEFASKLLLEVSQYLGLNVNLNELLRKIVLFFQPNSNGVDVENLINNAINMEVTLLHTNARIFLSDGYTMTIEQVTDSIHNEITFIKLPIVTNLLNNFSVIQDFFKSNSDKLVNIETNGDFDLIEEEIMYDGIVVDQNIELKSKKDSKEAEKDLKSAKLKEKDLGIKIAERSRNNVSFDSILIDLVPSNSREMEWLKGLNEMFFSIKNFFYFSILSKESTFVSRRVFENLINYDLEERFLDFSHEWINGCFLVFNSNEEPIIFIKINHIAQLLKNNNEVYMSKFLPEDSELKIVKVYNIYLSCANSDLMFTEIKSNFAIENSLSDLSSFIPTTTTTTTQTTSQLTSILTIIKPNKDDKKEETDESELAVELLNSEEVPINTSRTTILEDKIIRLKTPSTILKEKREQEEKLESAVELVENEPIKTEIEVKIPKQIRQIKPRVRLERPKPLGKVTVNLATAPSLPFDLAQVTEIEKPSEVVQEEEKLLKDDENDKPITKSILIMPKEPTQFGIEYQHADKTHPLRYTDNEMPELENDVDDVVKVREIREQLKKEEESFNISLPEKEMLINQFNKIPRTIRSEMFALCGLLIRSYKGNKSNQSLGLMMVTIKLFELSMIDGLIKINRPLDINLILLKAIKICCEYDNQDFHLWFNSLIAILNSGDRFTNLDHKINFNLNPGKTVIENLNLEIISNLPEEAREGFRWELESIPHYFLLVVKEDAVVDGEKSTLDSTIQVLVKGVPQQLAMLGGLILINEGEENERVVSFKNNVSYIKKKEDRKPSVEKLSKINIKLINTVIIDDQHEFKIDPRTKFSKEREGRLKLLIYFDPRSNCDDQAEFIKLAYDRFDYAMSALANKVDMKDNMEVLDLHYYSEDLLLDNSILALCKSVNQIKIVLINPEMSLDPEAPIYYSQRVVKEFERRSKRWLNSEWRQYSLGQLNLIKTVIDAISKEKELKLNPEQFNVLLRQTMRDKFSIEMHEPIIEQFSDETEFDVLIKSFAKYNLLNKRSLWTLSNGIYNKVFPKVNLHNVFLITKRKNLLMLSEGDISSEEHVKEMKCESDNVTQPRSQHLRGRKSRLIRDSSILSIFEDPMIVQKDKEVIIICVGSMGDNLPFYSLALNLSQYMKVTLICNAAVLPLNDMFVIKNNNFNNESLIKFMTNHKFDFSAGIEALSNLGNELKMFCSNWLNYIIKIKPQMIITHEFLPIGCLSKLIFKDVVSIGISLIPLPNIFEEGPNILNDIFGRLSATSNYKSLFQNNDLIGLPSILKHDRVFNCYSKLFNNHGDGWIRPCFSGGEPRSCDLLIMGSSINLSSISPQIEDFIIQHFSNLVVLISVGKSGLNIKRQNVMNVTSVNPEKISTKYVMHHCGAGLTQTALFMGWFSICTPMAGDQFFFAEKLVQLKMGCYIKDFNNQPKLKIDLDQLDLKEFLKVQVQPSLFGDLSVKLNYIHLLQGNQFVHLGNFNVAMDKTTFNKLNLRNTDGFCLTLSLMHYFDLIGIKLPDWFKVSLESDGLRNVPLGAIEGFLSCLGFNSLIKTQTKYVLNMSYYGRPILPFEITQQGTRLHIEPLTNFMNLQFTILAKQFFVKAKNQITLEEDIFGEEGSQFYKLVQDYLETGDLEYLSQITNKPISMVSNHLNLKNIQHVINETKVGLCLIDGIVYLNGIIILDTLKLKLTTNRVVVIWTDIGWLPALLLKQHNEIILITKLIKNITYLKTIIDVRLPFNLKRKPRTGKKALAKQFCLNKPTLNYCLKRKIVSDGTGIEELEGSLIIKYFDNRFHHRSNFKEIVMKFAEKTIIWLGEQPEDWILKLFFSNKVNRCRPVYNGTVEFEIELTHEAMKKILLREPLLKKLNVLENDDKLIKLYIKDPLVHELVEELLNNYPFLDEDNIDTKFTTGTEEIDKTTQHVSCFYVPVSENEFMNDLVNLADAKSNLTNFSVVLPDSVWNDVYDWKDEPTDKRKVLLRNVSYYELRKLTLATLSENFFISGNQIILFNSNLKEQGIMILTIKHVIAKGNWESYGVLQDNYVYSHGILKKKYVGNNKPNSIEGTNNDLKNNLQVENVNLLALEAKPVVVGGFNSGGASNEDVIRRKVENFYKDVCKEPIKWEVLNLFDENADLINYWDLRDMDNWIHYLGFNHPTFKYKTKRFSDRMIETEVLTHSEHPLTSRPTLIKQGHTTENAISSRFFSVVKYRKIDIKVKEEIEDFISTYFVSGWKAIIDEREELNPICINAESTKKWLMERPEGVEIDEELKQILAEGFEINKLNNINIHTKLEALIKVKIVNHNEETQARIIAWQAKGLCAIYSPVFLEGKHRLKMVLKPNILYTDGLTPMQMLAGLETMGQCNWFISNDLEKQDRQTDSQTLNCEFSIYSCLKIPTIILQSWRRVHCNWRFKSPGVSGYCDQMRLTGQATTALGNAIVNLLVNKILVKTLGSNFVGMLVLGDDNSTLSKIHLDLEGVTQFIKSKYNMASKLEIGKTGTFCRFLINIEDGRPTLYPDFYRMLQRYELSNITANRALKTINERKLSYLYVLGDIKNCQLMVNEICNDMKLLNWYQLSSALIALGKLYNIEYTVAEGILEALLTLLHSKTSFVYKFKHWNSTL